ncbi:hypothetical protein [Hyphomicrobium sp. CS1BSMeth3]|uniref:hypothetical protein n=1 Tax=Hyphomicrobium sp. CS1BSMeth3 TaxID=1892844 RepID=UPI0009306C05|nr:hypothetical protein [Hyphomicrobium sp. CS1BSMeth3]
MEIFFGIHKACEVVFVKDRCNVAVIGCSHLLECLSDFAGSISIGQEVFDVGRRAHTVPPWQAVGFREAVSFGQYGRNVVIEKFEHFAELLRALFSLVSRPLS